ncbi:MAG: diadenylate cyclase [Spirochaetales bacterium]|nr:diadenylate cyclase [Spirochaetales bacterium]
MEEYELDKFMETARLCAKEVLGVFEPNILRKLDFYSCRLNITMYSSPEEKEFEILKTMSDFKQSNDTSMRKHVISKEYILENDKLTFLYMSYAHRSSLVKNDFFIECCKELLNNFTFQYKCQKLNFYNTEYYQTILKTAAINLLNSLSEECLIFEQNTSIFSNINELSLLTYEKNKTNGLIYFLFTDELDKYSNYMFEFSKKISFNNENCKLLRKYLELTDAKNNIGLISDTNFIYGIGEEDKDLNYFSVIYKNGFSWELLQKEKKLFSVKNNKIFIENEDLFLREFATIYKQEFSNVFDNSNLKNIQNCILSLFRENKGTILVISNKSEDIIQNKYNDLSTLIDKIKLDENNIKKLSSIDGAIFIDEKANCYGFGAILDGLDNQKGNPARGSRYNSSQRFFSYYKKKYSSEDLKLLVFVLSDDGNYDIFPQKTDWYTMLLDYIGAKKKCSIIDLYDQFKSLSPSRIQRIIQNALAFNLIKQKSINGIPYYEIMVF